MKRPPNARHRQRPVATVVVGGLITATILSFVVLLAIYLVMERGVQRRHAALTAKEGYQAS